MDIDTLTRKLARLSLMAIEKQESNCLEIEIYNCLQSLHAQPTIHTCYIHYVFLTTMLRAVLARQSIMALLDSIEEQLHDTSFGSTLDRWCGFLATLKDSHMYGEFGIAYYFGAVCHYDLELESELWQIMQLPEVKQALQRHLPEHQSPESK